LGILYVAGGVISWQLRILYVAVRSYM
jgi:hypothetical protein